MTMSLQELAQEALDVQDACNLSGVVHSFSRCMTALSEHGLDTPEKNRHPVAILFSNKIAQLTGSESAHAFASAYDWCNQQKSTAKPSGLKE